MLRLSIALLIAAVSISALAWLSYRQPPLEPTLSSATPPPPAPRPPGLRPSIKWFPESPRYLAARRQHYASSRDFRSQLDLSTEQVSRERHYRVRIAQRPEPALNRFQTWQLQIATAKGQPVVGAVINATGGMPQHGHGMPTQPRARPGETAGEYHLEGLEFSMPGWWEVSVYVSKDRLDDIATFNVLVE